MNCYFISPHLDDVALSCAGLVQTRVARGDNVTIISLFTRCKNRTIQAKRASEDFVACDRAGTQALDLGFDDAPNRPGITTTFTSLVLDTKIDRELVRSIRNAIREHTRDADEVWIPLAVGGHIDHRTVFEARPPNARLYEDRPYAFVPALSALRRRELCGGKPIILEPHAILTQLQTYRCLAFVHEDERDHVAAELSRRLATPIRATGKLRMRSHPIPDRTRAISMITAYSSQVRAIFGIEPLSKFWPTVEREAIL